jgi:mycothiol synthase
MQVNIEVHQHLLPEVVDQVKQIIRAATATDEMAPLSEHVLIHLNQGGDYADEHFLARLEDGTLVGYLHLDETDEVAGPVVEIVVHPEFRNKGIGTKLVLFSKEKVKDARLRLWAHGELGSAYALAQKLGFTKSRELWQMRRSLYAELPKLELNQNISLRNFVANQDEEEFISLNKQVFAEHPEQSRLDLPDLLIRMKEAWFTPTGFFLAQNNNKDLIGFNWTKIHGSETTDSKHGHFKIGEIYVLGVSPANREKGLGRALAIRGLEYLRDQGLGAAMLYVDRDNLPAIKLYESIGFAHWDTDVMFQA